MRYKEIVFDVDGTLIDTEYAVLHSLQDTVCQFTGETPEIGKRSTIPRLSYLPKL